MSREWIKWSRGLTRKREVLALADKLGVDVRVAACLCMEVWEWADLETEDGHIRGASRAHLDRAVGFTGLADGLESVGWLRVTDAGLTLPNWETHNSKSAKKRATEAFKKRRQRASRYRPDRVPLPSGQERDQNTSPSHSPSGLDSGSGIPEGGLGETTAVDRAESERVARMADVRGIEPVEAVRAVLTEWGAYRFCRGKKWNLWSANALVREAVKRGWSAEKFAGCVQASIANMWERVCDPDDGRFGGKPSDPEADRAAEHAANVAAFRKAAAEREAKRVNR